MSRRFHGGSFTSTVHETQGNGTVYVYEREYVYDPATHRNRRVSNRLVGKIMPGSDEIVPTRPKKKQAGGEQDGAEHGGALEQVEAIRFRGQLTRILDWAGKESGVDDDLKASMELGDALKAASFARYLTATGGETTPGIEKFQLEHPLPYAHPMTDDVCYRFFSATGGDETGRQRFFAARARRLGGDLLVALDSTLDGTYSGEQVEARHVKHGDEQDLKKIKIIVLYAVRAMEPIAFFKVPGNIPDGSTLASVLQQLQALDLPGVQLVTDNRHWSEANLGVLAHEHVNFIALAQTSIEWIADKVEQAAGSIQSIERFDPATGLYVRSWHERRTFKWRRKYGSGKKKLKAGDFEEFERSVWIHVCLDPARKEREDQELFRNLLSLRGRLEAGEPLEDMSMADREEVRRYLVVRLRRDGRLKSVTWNRTAIEDACRRHGFFALVANREKNGVAALHKYRRREYVEGFFWRYKGHADGRRPRVWRATQLMGRLMVQFAALCFSDFLRRRIHQMMDSLRSELSEAAKAGEPESRHRIDRSLLHWLEQTPFLEVLRWFDAYENYEANTEIRSRRWNTATTIRDKRFIELLEHPIDS